MPSTRKRMQERLDALDAEEQELGYDSGPSYTVEDLPESVVRRVGQLVMERDELAARLRAWEPVVRAAQKLSDEIVGSFVFVDASDLREAIRALPPEHRP